MTFSTSDVHQGDLSQVPFAELLWGISQAKLTGLLELEREDQGKQIFFEQGQPMYAKSSFREENLCRQLVREGLLTDVQEEKALLRASEDSKPLARVLVDMDILDPRQLHNQMRKNLVYRILQCFSWEEGSYQFLEDRFSIEAVVASRMSPARLVLEGVRRMLPELFLEEVDPEKLYSLKHDVASELENWKLKENELAFLHTLTTPHSPTGLAKAAKRDLNDVRRDFYAFRLLGLLVEGDGERPLDELVAETLVSILHSAQVVPTTSLTSEDLQRRLATDHLRFMGMDFFELLGVSETSSPEEVEEAFQAFNKELDHSLPADELGEEEHEQLDEIKAKGEKARDVLLNERLRSDYLETVKRAPIKAEFERGMNLLRSRKYPEAVEAFSQVRERDSENPTIAACWGWATFLENPDADLSDAENALREARSHLANPHAAFYLGKFLLANGKTEEAIEHLQVAVHLSPKIPSRQEELRRAKTWLTKKPRY